MKRRLHLIVLAVCVCGFVWGVAELFRLRFEFGDVYPPYSTLRNDPLGASAFFEALQRMPGVTPSRDFSADDRLPEGPRTAYLHLAGDSNDWTELPEHTFNMVDQFVRRGGRLVVAFQPVATAGSWSARPLPMVPPSGTNIPPGTNRPASRSSPPMVRPARRDPDIRTISIPEKWGLGFQVRDLKMGANDSYEPVEVLNAGGSALPDSLAWHSGGVFIDLDPAWHVIYQRGTNAVLIERQFGRGSVVLATDSYFISNEAMARDRHAELLAWLVGPSTQIIFDEAHLGIVQEPGVAMLMRKYQLGGFFASLLFLAALFLWKNASPLAPPIEPSPDASQVMGKDSAAGFVNLLRRNIAYREILHVCLTEWRKSGIGLRYSPARLTRAQAVIDAENARPAGERDAIRTYREICEALNDRSGVPPKNNPSPKP